jgi:hypothetical protein
MWVTNRIPQKDTKNYHICIIIFDILFLDKETFTKKWLQNPTYSSTKKQLSHSYWVAACRLVSDSMLMSSTCCNPPICTIITTKQKSLLLIRFLFWWRGSLRFASSPVTCNKGKTRRGLAGGASSDAQVSRESKRGWLY